MSERLTYTVDEAARLLGLGRSSTYALVKSGRLPPIRVGRRILITKRALTALLGAEPKPPEL